MILLNKLFSAEKSAKGRVNYPLLLLGAVIYGVSVGLVLSPNEIAPGGASGLAVMLSRFLPLGVGSLTMAINLPLLAVSLYVFGWRFLLGTVVAIAVSGLTADMCTLLHHSQMIFSQRNSRRYSVGRRLWDSFSFRGNNRRN